MGRGNKKKKRAGKKFAMHNFLPEAGPGCHIARYDVSLADWVLEWENVDPADFEGEDVPDIAVDPDEHTLTLCNTENFEKVAYITIYESRLRGRDGKNLTSGTTLDSSGNKISCTTLIALCGPKQFCHLCYLPESISPSSLRMDSDVQAWQKHPDPFDTHTQAIGFPLSGESFLCTQGVGGCLTHFFSGNMHAIDFKCNLNTPVLAVGNGVVVAVKTNCNVSGIAVGNLFDWNSITLKLDASTPCPVCEPLDNHHALRPGPLFVEYVHILSATVKPGDRVVAGQTIGASGSVGFSPEAHLHLAAYRSDDDSAATCQVYFRCRDSVYLPIAGQRYSIDGPIERKA